MKSEEKHFVHLLEFSIHEEHGIVQELHLDPSKNKPSLQDEHEF